MSKIDYVHNFIRSAHRSHTQRPSIFCYNFCYKIIIIIIIIIMIIIIIIIIIIIMKIMKME